MIISLIVGYYSEKTYKINYNIIIFIKYGPLEIWGPGHLPTLTPSKSGTACMVLWGIPYDSSIRSIIDMLILSNVY